MSRAALAFAFALLAAAGGSAAQKPAGTSAQAVAKVKPVKPADSAQDKAAAPAPAPEAALPAVSPETYKEIRDLQYEQDQKIIALKELKLQEAQVQKEVDELERRIQQVAYLEAIKSRLDVEKTRLILATVSWVKTEEKKK